MSEQRKYYKGSSDGKAPSSADPLEGVAERYDAIVIGSGLGGMTAANVLGKAGRRVLLVEQHYNFGGLATWFKRRGGHVFDISLHGFPIGMKKTCRKYWNSAIADSIVQLDGVRFDNPQFCFDTTFTAQDFAHKLETVFGLERARIDAFFAELRATDFYGDSGETTAAFFERHFPGRNDVHRLLMEPISYANGSTLDDPALSYRIVFGNFMSQGVYTFAGGTDQLVKAMKAELERQGVELRNKVQVEKIRVEGGRVTGIEAHGRFIACDAVVSNASLKGTVLGLVGAEHFTPEFAAGVQSVRLNTSSCQVYLGLAKGESIPFVTDLLFTSTRPTFTSEALCDFDGESRTFSFYYPKTRAGLDRYTIVSSTNARWEDWSKLSDAQYDAAKRRLIETTLLELERYVPGVTHKIEHTEAATPRTFQFYTQAPEGTSFGTKFEGLKYSMNIHDEIRGLFHAGSVGIIMSGWLGAANYGVIVANKCDAWLHALLEVHA
ncbi:MAG: NAD(P)/FAD-dependent oxidoreductase [Planctomycetes bacterium]|nr:NAD(P)/FAD-dependent oxidoreductase [Planctomycetota bacterium]